MHRCASGFMVFFFAVFAVYGARLFFMGSVAGRGKSAAVAMMLWFAFLAAFAIGMQRWYNPRIIARAGRAAGVSAGFSRAPKYSVTNGTALGEQLRYRVGL